jgi:serine/threonine protein kinase
MSNSFDICRNGDVTKVYSFDGQTIWYDRSTSLFEVGNFLGGGAAGNVYECEHLASRNHFALKILNPLGYKLISPTLLRKCNIVSKGETFNDIDEYEKVEKKNVWWLINGSTKQFIAAYFSERQNCLKEFSLVQCIQVWRSNALSIGDDDNENIEESVEVIQVAGGPRIYVPSISPKFADFIRRRNRIFREIRNMRKIPTHTNVIRLEGVLELTQESKCTIFLVMELANGGELFDRIKLDCGTREETAKLFFQQLLQGVMHCHSHGVCHRDLKPENLLLQDTADSGTILKIADFGFSARFAMGDSDGAISLEKDDWAGKEMSSSSFKIPQVIKSISLNLIA